ncbi:hypothetical protein KIN20_014557 [Parelaphostrongylus tenuis]|uniref:Deacetylase sirtuin-type domain-containing protein n=1 Tax=Parelaphostrongylus tenuis TaxID=148309 RepID=A0AAD5QRZ8_PARTN|nr:hypothetical protein KIN20_014557 [Parelaphostrongylus tenuis]
MRENDSGREISWRGQGTLKQSATLLISLSPRGTIREVCRLITQNVDGLHTKAGSTLLTELHGCGHRVRCMQCNEVTSREEHQLTLEKLNAEWMKVNVPGEIAPDGDVEIQEGAHESFVLAPCKKCGGILKTDVVFFGDNVIQSEVDKCYEKLDECSGVSCTGIVTDSVFRIPIRLLRQSTGKTCAYSKHWSYSGR